MLHHTSPSPTPSSTSSPIPSPTPTPLAFSSISAAESFAREHDAADPLASFRDQFAIPPASAALAGTPGWSRPAHTNPSEPRAIYLTGNSLGCMPIAARQIINDQLDDWSLLGVEGHLHARDPWLPYHEQFRTPLAHLVGALPHEVVCMNSLTVNLHLLLASFYRPTRERHAIIIEDFAFPSDSYAVASQAAFHGFDPATSIIRLRPRPGESILRTEDIESTIRANASKLALVMLGAVNYLTGQFFDMPRITKAAHDAGALCGWDLAHAVGNVPMHLHDINADFAAWCSYKYLNAGAGAVAGAFIHERHVARSDLQQFAGWWGNDPSARFKMKPDFVPIHSADRWQLSNPPIFAMMPLKASLAIFEAASIDRLRAKSIILTTYLEALIDTINAPRAEAARIRVLTPREPDSRGCQLSLIMPGDARATFTRLQHRGVICDFREPNIIRAAPTPLYTRFIDVYHFAHALDEATRI